MGEPVPYSAEPLKFSAAGPITWATGRLSGTPDHWTPTAMTNPHGAELIPFDQVHRLVQERRQRAAAQADVDAGSLMAARTSQVRRLLTEQRARPTGPEIA